MSATYIRARRILGEPSSLQERIAIKDRQVVVPTSKYNLHIRRLTETTPTEILPDVSDMRGVLIGTIRTNPWIGKYISMEKLNRIDGDSFNLHDEMDSLPIGSIGALATLLGNYAGDWLQAKYGYEDRDKPSPHTLNRHRAATGCLRKSLQGVST
ncbi:MAG: hypothetical protein Q9210_000519 [Variospora velana]